MILNLDPHFNPFPESQPIEFEAFTFSGGEPHIKIKSEIPIGTEITISHRLNSFNDFGLLLLAIDALKRMECSDLNVFIPYFPAARQDRVMIAGEPLTVKVYTDILNQQGLKKVMIYDPHSEVCSALLNNCKVVSNHTFIESVLKELPDDLLLVAPDGGALKKIHQLAFYLKKYEVLECSKSRDVATGKLSGFKVNEENLKQKPCLIVDDICDGGGTFLGLAKELKRKNAGDLYLAVSHGIFSKGVNELAGVFDKIFTTDSVKENDSDQVVQKKLGKLIL